MTIDATEITWDESVDVLVVGGGGCGLTAAVTAAAADIDVTVLEKQPEFGGNTALSTGGIVAAGSKLQAEHGVEDDPEILAADILEYNEGRGDPDLIHAIAEESGPTIDWFVEEIGVGFRVTPDSYGIVGHSVDRAHWPVDDGGDISRSGEPIIAGLVAEAEERGVDLRTAEPVDDLVVDGDRVVGVATRPTLKPYGLAIRRAIRAERIVLATDGFGRNYELRRDRCPETLDMMYWGSAGNEGDTIRWAEELGLEILDVSYLGFPMSSYPEGVWLPGELPQEGAILVNRNGERFIDAGRARYTEMTYHIMDQPGSVAYVVFDDRMHGAMAESGISSQRFSNCLERDVFETAGDVDGLAERLGLPVEAFRETVAAVNAAATGEDDTEFGRAVTETLSPPLYGTMIKPALAETLGGLRVDTDGHVLRDDGSPVDTLFAGGGASRGVTGGTPGGYLPGNGLLVAFNLGRIIGRQAASECA